MHQIARMIANGDSSDDLLREYPSLSGESISAGSDYVASLAEEQVTRSTPWRSQHEHSCR